MRKLCLHTWRYIQLTFERMTHQYKMPCSMEKQTELNEGLAILKDMICLSSFWWVISHRLEVWETKMGNQRAYWE
jgi:hypothetical protein